MGLSNLQAPTDGLLCILLVNTALTTISIFRRIFRPILPIPSSADQYYSSSTSSSSSSSFEFFQYPNYSTSSTPPPPPPHRSSSSDQYTTFIEEFHKRVPAIRFDSITINSQQDCTVCLTRFEPDSEVNRLGHCGHIFHKLCLEGWLDYNNVTCPLCRTPLLLMDSSSSFDQLVLQHQDHHHHHQEEEEEASVLAFGDQIF